MSQTEDIPYEVSDFATPEPEKKVDDVDQPNKSVLIEVLKEIESDIIAQNTFSSISLPQNATPEQKIAVFDEIAIHKGLAVHLEKYKLMIENKVKELR